MRNWQRLEELERAYRFVEQYDEHDPIRVYPLDAPYCTRDQGLRASDELVAVVLDDIADLLEDIGSPDVGKARELAKEAEALWEGENFGGWLEDPDASEQLRDILWEAEQLDGVYVEWDGEAGMVRITAADRWIELEGDES